MLTTRGGQSNYSIVFIFATSEEKGYYRFVSVGQVSFDWRSYCGRSRRIQGISSSENQGQLVRREKI